MADRIHQEIDFPAPPDRVYRALTDAKMFTEFSGSGAADIANEPGGVISLFGGYVTGRNIELVPNQRVVQAWRGKTWEEGDSAPVPQPWPACWTASPVLLWSHDAEGESEGRPTCR